jgi:hypothetical protein
MLVCPSTEGLPTPPAATAGILLFGLQGCRLFHRWRSSSRLAGNAVNTGNSCEGVQPPAVHRPIALTPDGRGATTNNTLTKLAGIVAILKFHPGSKGFARRDYSNCKQRV